MASNQKIFLVYDDFSINQPILMGKLYVSVIKGGETYSFEYDKDWLKRTGLALTLDPEGEFLSNDKKTAAPPWATLRTLEEASGNFEKDETGLSEKWLNQLI